ncbi:MAG: tetratricopeptide repeat protein [Planctomycetaceae bacterium]
MTLPRRIFVFVILLVAGALALVMVPLIIGVWRNLQRSDLAAQCRAASERRKWNELRKLADSWIAWDSQNAEAWQFRAKAANAQHDWPAAADSFWRVSDTDPQAIPSLIEVSKIAFTHLNDPLKGRDACERILRIDPRAAGAHQQLIWFHAMTLQREKLLQQILAAIAAQQEPREAYVYFFLADTLRSSTAVQLNAHWLEANRDEEMFLVARVLHLTDSETASSGSPAASSNDDQPLNADGRSKLELVDELLQRFPHNLELLAHKALERLTANDPHAAANLLAQAPPAAAQDSRFWRIKGWIHESNNELDEAATAYRRGLELHALDWSTMNRLAIVERRRQNIDEVQRLTQYREQAHEIRRQLRQQPAVELVTPSILRELLTLCHECGEQEIGPALERRFANFKTR